MEHVTYESIVKELRELRLSRDQADARLLVRLQDVERDHLSIVLESGCDSFAQFVQEFVKPARYEAFKLGLAKIGEEQALAIGSDATIVAGKATSAVIAEEYTSACKAWVVEHGGTMPTRESAERVMGHYQKHAGKPKSLADQERREDELSRLRAENAELRAKLRSAESELTRLRKLAAKPAQRARTAAPQPHARGRKDRPKG